MTENQPGKERVAPTAGTPFDPAQEHVLPIDTKSPEDLRGIFMRGLAWTAAMRWASQLFSWISTLVVARLLAPEDYGLVSMAAVYLGFLGLMSEFGFGSAIITLRTITPKQIEQLNLAAVMLGVACFLVSCAAAIPLGQFFESPQLPMVILVMSLGFVISSFRSVPNALLQRDMSFKSLAVIEGVQSLALAGVMVLLAVLGFGYWTLVIGNLLSAILLTALTLAQCRRGFAWPKWEGLQPAITFGRQVLFVRLAWYSYTNSDFFVAGRRLGREPLGAYSLAWTLASVPIEKIGVLIFNTAPAFFSALKHDKAGLRRNLLHLTEGIALLTVPLSVGLALVATEFVPLALGRKWMPMIVPLQLLAVYGTVRSVAPLISQILHVTGDTRFSMWNSIAAAVVLPIGFFVGSYWGIDGIAATWLILHPIVLVMPYRRALRKIDLPFRTYLGAVWPAVNGALHMSAVVILARLALPAAVPLSLEFAIFVFLGASAYLGTLFLYHRDRIAGLKRTIQKMRGVGA